MVQPKIRVRYFNVFQSVTGKKEEEFTITADTTVADVLYSLARIYGSKAENYLYDNRGRLKPAVRLFYNDKLLEVSDLNRTVSAGDELEIMLAISGG